MIKRILIGILCSAALIAPARAQSYRPQLTSDTVFNVSASGTDSGNNCIASACRTMNYAAQIMALYDAASWNVTMRVAAGCSTCGPLSMTMPVIGARSVSILCGDGLSVQCENAVHDGDAISITAKQVIKIAGFNLETIVGSGGNGLSVGYGAEVHLGTMGWGQVNGEHIFNNGIVVFDNDQVDGSGNKYSAQTISGSFNHHLHSINGAVTAWNNVFYTVSNAPTIRYRFIGIAGAQMGMGNTHFSGPFLVGGPPGTGLQYYCHGNAYMRITGSDPIPGVGTSIASGCQVEQ